MAKKFFAFSLIILVLTLFCISVAAAAAGSSRDCVNCGVNCAPGSCDVSDACSQCLINGCVVGGQPVTLNCGTTSGQLGD